MTNQNNLVYSQNGSQSGDYNKSDKLKTVLHTVHFLAVAPRQVESMMPPPAPVLANPAPSSNAQPGGTVTRQSAMNPQGLTQRNCKV